MKMSGLSEPWKEPSVKTKATSTKQHKNIQAYKTELHESEQNS